MSVLLNNRMTLAQLQMLVNPDGTHAKVANVMELAKPALSDFVWQQANGITHHKIVRAANQPTLAARKLNAGVARQNLNEIPVLETMGIYDTIAEIDSWIVKNSPNPAETRTMRAYRFLDGLAEGIISKLLYGNASLIPEDFTGLAPRLDSTSQGNVISGGGSTTLTSIYVVKWGQGGAYMIYPKGHPNTGIEHMDEGEVTGYDASYNPLRVYRDWYGINCGFCVEDDRAIARYCNIEPDGGANGFNEDLLIQLLNEMPDDGAGTVIYCNQTIKTQMEIKLKDKSNVNFTTDNGLGGAPILKFRGIPVRKIDKNILLNTETVVS